MPRARLSLALLIAVTGPALAQQAPAPEPTTEGEAGLGSLLAPRRAQSTQPRSELDRIAEQLEALAARRDAAVAQDSLERGRAAVDRARQARAAGDEAGAERATQIAWAAVSLASRQLARDHARRELAAAKRRVATAQAERERVRAELEQLKQRLAALRAQEAP